MKKYRTSDLAKEWGTTTEAVRRYVREIKADPELLNAGLIEVTKAGTLITEKGYFYLIDRRSRWTNEEPPQIDTPDSLETEHLKKRIQELEEKNEDLKTELDYMKGQNTDLIRLSESLTSALQAQQVLTLNTTSQAKETPQNAGNEVIDAKEVEKESDTATKETPNNIEAETPQQPKRGLFSWLFRR